VTISGQGQFSFEDMTEATNAILKGQIGGPTKVSRSWLGWLIFLGVAVAIFVFMQRKTASIARPTPPIVASPNTLQNVLQDVVLPILPWMLIFGFVWFSVYRGLRKRRSTFWDNTPSMHRSRTWTIDDDGLTVAEPFSQHRTVWGGYTRFQETKNLFLLYTGKHTAEMIPKRVLGSDEQIEAARQILQRNVSAPAGAFPVIAKTVE
jgi:YcxB-like protein